MATAADFEARDAQLHRVAELEERVACITVQFEEIARVLGVHRAREAQLVQRYADASDAADRTDVEAMITGLADEMDRVQQYSDALEAELRGCKEELREARLACEE